jgi:hypothetical protein
MYLRASLNVDSSVILGDNPKSRHLGGYVCKYCKYTYYVVVSIVVIAPAKSHKAGHSLSDRPGRYI